VRPEASEVLELLCDHRKAKALLGWQPQVSLEAGLERTVHYIKDNLSLYKPGIYNV
jgi:dTDP-glucose 4,6-dehydratase